VSKCEKQEKIDWKRVGYIELTAARSGCTGLSGGAPDCPVVHRTVSGAPEESKVNRPLSGLDDDVRL
jgi:hypothetical protein